MPLVEDLLSWRRTERDAAVGSGRRAPERHTGPIEIDTLAVSFVDSTVIAVFAALAHRQPGRLRFINPSESVRFLLDLTQLAQIIEVIDDASL